MDMSDQITQLSANMESLMKTVGTLATEQSVRELSAECKSIDAKVAGVLESIEYTQGEVDNIIDFNVKHTEYTNQLGAATKYAVNKVDVLITQNEALSRKAVKAEDYSKRMNLLLHGIPEKRGEGRSNCEEKIRNIFKEQLQLSSFDSITIQDCHRVGRFKAGNIRPIIVQFLYLKEKISVFQVRLKLKDTDYRMSQHFSEETTAIRKVLGPLVKICIDAGKKATLIGDQILVDGKMYTIEKVHNIPGIEAQAPATKQDSKKLVFNGRLSMLSNFYTCYFFTNGQLFNSNEQYFQYKKACAAGRPEIATRILATSNPVTQKTLGQATNMNDNDWQSYETMKHGAVTKFSQNKALFDFLHSTTNKEL